jgi:hypothetical protein
VSVSVSSCVAQCRVVQFVVVDDRGEPVVMVLTLLTLLSQADE